MLCAFQQPSITQTDPFTDWTSILMGGIAVALVSFTDTSVLSRTYAARLRAPVDPNREMVGQGIANLFAAFFQGFPVSSSSSRIPVAKAAGAKTQLTGIVGASAFALLLLVAPQLLQDLPQPKSSAEVLALDHLLRRCGRVRCHPGHRHYDRDCGD